MKNPRIITASVQWTGYRHNGTPYEPHVMLRPNIRFPDIPELDGIHGSWDALIEEALHFDPLSRDSTIRFSMTFRAPTEKIVEHARFGLYDGPKEIAVGKVLSIDSA